MGQEDPLEKEMITHLSILPWEIPWTEEPGRLQSMGVQESRTWLSDQTISLKGSTFFFSFDHTVPHVES